MTVELTDIVQGIVDGSAGGNFLTKGFHIRRRRKEVKRAVEERLNTSYEEKFGVDSLLFLEEGIAFVSMDNPPLVRAYTTYGAELTRIGDNPTTGRPDIYSPETTSSREGPQLIYKTAFDEKGNQEVRVLIINPGEGTITQEILASGKKDHSIVRMWYKSNSGTKTLPISVDNKRYDPNKKELV